MSFSVLLIWWAAYAFEVWLAFWGMTNLAEMEAVWVFSLVNVACPSPLVSRNTVTVVGLVLGFGAEALSILVSIRAKMANVIIASAFFNAFSSVGLGVFGVF
jgi:hypothetical protein